ARQSLGRTDSRPEGEERPGVLEDTSSIILRVANLRPASPTATRCTAPRRAGSPYPGAVADHNAVAKLAPSIAIPPLNSPGRAAVTGSTLEMLTGLIHRCGRILVVSERAANFGDRSGRKARRIRGAGERVPAPLG